LIKENIKKCGLWPIENEIPFVFEPYVPAVWFISHSVLFCEQLCCSATLSIISDFPTVPMLM
jgi:hypothetical protein